MRTSTLLQCVQGLSCNRVTYTKRRICVLKGSTVDISCTYDSGYDTVTSSLWFSPKQSDNWKDELIPEDLTRDPGYAGRVKYTGTYKDPFTLRISDLREEDSAEYRFTFKTHYFELGLSFPGTTLSVTDKPKNTSVSVSPSGEIVEGSSVTLTCSSDANPPVQSYIWWFKKNGGGCQSMTGPEHVFNQIQSSDTGEYYCEAQNEMGTDRSRTINMDVKCE
ncbi:B-cell receptor CD22-like [Salvelinus alpinus]|uniref:B-cell receptor CD22-like n=1 Tax=Salvelinus alpinus TaxID=8036 RepID=UPI0039FDBCE3